MTFKTLTLLLVGLTCCSTITSQPVSPLWDPAENRETYVHFPMEPESFKTLLDEEFHTLMRSPQLGIFTTVPEPDQRVWPLVKGMMLRNHLDNKILWAHPNYLITDGLEYGCRELVGDTEVHVPVPSTLCDDHCLHQGRYCAPFQPSNLPSVLPPGFKGKELVKESLRRLCFDKYYHASDTKYFEYLEGFDRAQCLQQPDVSQCSMQVIDGVDHADYSNFAYCVNETSWDLDVEHQRLEDQLKEAKQHGTTLDTVPEVRIGGTLLQQPPEGVDYTTTEIFDAYCSAFADRPMHPVSCDVCGYCQNVRHCLWTLECDGKPFDAAEFMRLVEGENDDNTAMDEEESLIPMPKPTPATEAPQPQSSSTLPPGGVAQPGSTSDTTETESEYEAEEEESEKTGLMMLIVIICVAAVIVGFITYRDRRTKHLMNEIAAEQARNGTYRDDEIYIDYVDDTMRSAASIDDEVELSPPRTHTSQPPRMAFLPEMT